MEKNIEDLLLFKILKLGIEHGIFYIILGSFISGIIKAIYRQFRNQAIYDDVIKSMKVKTIISRLSANRVMLNANRILVTRIHNGTKWLNKEHMNKLSIYNTFTIEDYKTQIRYKNIDTVLQDIKLSELSEILIKVNKEPFDIISVEELPKDFDFKRILKSDKIKYIVLFKIQPYRKGVLGYIWVLFPDENKVIRDKEIYNDFLQVANEIGQEFR